MNVPYLKENVLDSSYTNFMLYFSSGFYCLVTCITILNTTGSSVVLLEVSIPEKATKLIKRIFINLLTIE